MLQYYNLLIFAAHKAPVPTSTIPAIKSPLSRLAPTIRCRLRRRLHLRYLRRHRLLHRLRRLQHPPPPQRLRQVYGVLRLYPVRGELRRGELAGLHLGAELLQRACDDVAHLGVLLAELGGHLGVVGVLHEPQQVMVHQHLAAGGVPGADADGGDLERRRDRRRHGPRHALQHHAEAPRLLQRQRVLDHLLRLLDVAPLRPEAPQYADGLRGEPHVPHHGDAGVHHGPGRRHPRRPAPLQLHRVHAALLQHADARLHRLRRRPLVGAEGEVADEQRP
mmetsp:Transcript_246/g.556  ORF Transcript_246/g.556 Transcript_246/m.556 type:complete len:277 (+) Transcript_246:43-873(+)